VRDRQRTNAGSVGYGTLLALAAGAKTGSTVTAAVNGIPTTVQVARDLTVAAGDVLVVQRVGSQWFALGRGYPAAPAEVNQSPAPDPKPPSTSGRTAFAPVETRSYRNGEWRSDNDHVYQGQYGGQGNHTGCAFYGNGPRSLAGATVTGASIAVRRRSQGGITAAQNTTMRLVTQRTRPAGAPTLGASTAGPHLAWGGVTSFGVPASWAQSIVDGTAGALGFFVSGGSPYVIFSGRSEYGPAFTLTINWSR
jgi:hypothetical protein